MAQAASTQIDYRALIDGLGQGVLLFDANGALMLDNLAARSILGQNLALIRSEGWAAITMLLDGPREGGPGVGKLREQSLRSPTPIRFHTYFAGAYTPCWIAAIYGASGAVFTMIIIEIPDWTALTELMTTFRNEARMSLSATRGHAELVKQLLRKNEDDPAVARLTQRVFGFTEIIATHMLRLQNLMDLLQRLEVIRVGDLRGQIREARRKIRLADFIEDFLEEFADESMADPDMGSRDFRERLTLYIPEDVQALAAPLYLAHVLHDVLRNAACYSEPGTDIMFRVYEVPNINSVQFDVIDQGYGVRDREQERVFQPFQRARQPQIIGVDGYGLSLYLAKAEIEAMGGHIWFESEEGVGSTFSFKLPIQSTGETMY
ncbi:sensor histidine kinase [Chloroflexota bacterium]